MAILVTGGCGYIGSHTCVELLQAGYEVVVVDNLSNSSLEALRRVEELTRRKLVFYKADLLHEDALERVFARHTFEAVIHFAGLKAVGESVREPLLYYRQNVGGTLVLCEQMIRHGVHRLVFSSSATVYGMPEQVPISESGRLSGMNPYGRTKWMIEQLLGDLAQSDPRWSIALLRYFNPIGAHPSGRIGEDPGGVPNNLMPYITQVAAGRRPELNIFGADYPTPDGTGVRDYIHVVDLASGHLRALEKVIATEGNIEAYNLGTGHGYSVLELVHAFEQVTGKPVPRRITERRPGDVAVCYADPAKAERELGWRALRGLEEMCRDAWRWQSRNPDGYRGEARELVDAAVPAEHPDSMLMEEHA